MRGFLLNNALFHLQELHADGFRYDEISMMLAMNAASGWEFCRELTQAVRARIRACLQNAEYWPAEFGAPTPADGAAVSAGGLGFDVVQHDGLREAIRTAMGQAAQGAGAYVGMSGIARWPCGGTGVCARVADDSVRGEPRHCEAGREAARPGAGGWGGRARGMRAAGRAWRWRCC